MKKIICIALGVILVLGGYIGWELWRSAYGLVAVEYEVPVEAGASAGPVRIVQLSDLHAMSFGEDNADLVAAVRDAGPDLIAMTGDMFSSFSGPGDLELVCRLVEDLSDLAPVYYALGNHELAYMASHGYEILDQLRSAGAVILDRSYVDLSVKGQDLRIGGCYGYLLSRDLRNGPEQDFLDDFLNTDRTTVLLAHMSEGLLAYNCIDDWNVDLVLSGHAHGGQIRLPFIGGLYDPETGWFPKYTRGAFLREDSAVVLSAGLGSSTDIPRFGNPPELVIIDLEPGA